MFKELLLNKACKEQHEFVELKGFGKRHISTLLMLTVSELAEALEADRKQKHANLEQFEIDEMYVFGRLEDTQEIKERWKASFERNIKDTFEDEIADAFLRLMDIVGEYGIDIEKHIKLKTQYNTLRPEKFGKQY